MPVYITAAAVVATKGEQGGHGAAWRCPARHNKLLLRVAPQRQLLCLLTEEQRNCKRKSDLFPTTRESSRAINFTAWASPAARRPSPAATTGQPPPSAFSRLPMLLPRAVSCCYCCSRRRTANRPKFTTRSAAASHPPPAAASCCHRSPLTGI